MSYFCMVFSKIDTTNNCVIVWLNHKHYSILYLKGDWESKMSDLNHEMNSSGSKCLATMFEWIAHYCKRSGSVLFLKGIQKAYFPFWRCSRSTHNNNIVVVNHCEVSSNLVVPIQVNRGHSPNQNCKFKKIAENNCLCFEIFSYQLVLAALWTNDVKDY